MPNIQFRASGRTLTSHAGLSIIGQCVEMAGIDSLDSRFPISQGVRNSDIVKAYLGLLCLGMSDFDAIENFRQDKSFKHLLNLHKVPSTATLRQRLEKLATQGLQESTASWSTTLLSLAKAPITAETTHVCLDIDTFVMDNSNSKKEGVSRTYQKVDGYTPIAAYLGNEGWCLGLELRPGKQHTMKESNAFLERVLPRAQGLTEQPLLLREDSGFDSQAHLALLEQQRRACAEDGRVLDYLVKWNPRRSAKEDLATWLAVAGDYWEELRPGKRQALWTQTVSIRDDDKVEYVVKRVMRLVERTADRDGQLLIEPDYELEGWWTSLDEAPQAVIQRYQAHATHEQFHSEPASGRAPPPAPAWGPIPASAHRNAIDVPTFS
ncbi:DDE family transposase [Halomonas sp. A11-A]|nr:DDE family transposase [Halomonas sp. A11-A]